MRPVTVEIIAVRGSAPRDAGTAMVVRADGIDGTIGGGALEYQAIAVARGAKALPREETIPLGPGLGQCCGGAVTLRFSYEARAVHAERAVGPLEVPAGWVRRPLWIWGAGHVGRAVVQHAAPLHAFDLTWVDTGAARFPRDVPNGVAAVPAADMPALMRHAPGDAAHLIFTYSHDFDLALCDAALRRGFGFCGVIGSATKWARFRSRLAAMGHSDAAIARITCPIGDTSRGKHPQDIAASTLAQVLMQSWAPGGTE
ncbi:MAG: xanthine dehydrogenase accessory protein XdhC [Pseudomonadota bacterium]